MKKYTTFSIFFVLSILGSTVAYPVQTIAASQVLSMYDKVLEVKDGNIQNAIIDIPGYSYYGYFTANRTLKLSTDKKVEYSKDKKQDEKSSDLIEGKLNLPKVERNNVVSNVNATVTKVPSASITKVEKQVLKPVAKPVVDDNNKVDAALVADNINEPVVSVPVAPQKPVTVEVSDNNGCLEPSGDTNTNTAPEVTKPVEIAPPVVTPPVAPPEVAPKEEVPNTEDTIVKPPKKEITNDGAVVEQPNEEIPNTGDIVEQLKDDTTAPVDKVEQPKDEENPPVEENKDTHEEETTNDEEKPAETEKVKPIVIINNFEKHNKKKTAMISYDITDMDTTKTTLKAKLFKNGIFDRELDVDGNSIIFDNLEYDVNYKIETELKYDLGKGEDVRRFYEK